MNTAKGVFTLNIVLLHHLFTLATGNRWWYSCTCFWGRDLKIFKKLNLITGKKILFKCQNNLLDTIKSHFFDKM